MFSKILAATDGSSNSLRAAENALEIAKLAKAKITLVYVVYVPRLYQGDISIELMESFVEDGQKILKDTSQVFSRANYPFTTKLIRGKKPAVAICSLAKKYDLLIIGTRGLHKKQERSLGSVSSCVIHCAPCPVLLVK